MTDDGGWDRRGPYGDEPEQAAPSGGRGRRRSSEVPDEGGHGYGGDQAGNPAPADPSAADPYGRAPQGYGPPQEYSQPQHPQPQQPQPQQPAYGQPSQGYTPQGYTPQGYTPQGYGTPPPPPPDQQAASVYGRRAAPRSGPKVVQSEVVDTSDPAYGYAAQDQYGQQQGRYGQRQDQHTQDSYGTPPTQPVDDGWGSTTANGNNYPEADPGGHAHEDDGRGGRGGGADDEGWDNHGGGGGQPWDGEDGDYNDAPRPRGTLRAWAPLVVLVAILSLFGGCMYAGYSYLSGKSKPGADFANTKANCADKDKVSVEVKSGSSQNAVAQTLFADGIVASTSAYVSAANSNQQSQTMQWGTYLICKGLSGDTAVTELLKRSNMDSNSQIVVSSGMTFTQIFAKVAKKRSWDVKALDAAAKDSAALGLPAWANNDIEGFLEPGTYQLVSTDTPASLLRKMVQARVAELTVLKFPVLAAKLQCGSHACSPEEALIIASMAESEVKTTAEDQGVSEAISNRLKANDWLNVDATTVYGLELQGKPTSPLTVAMTQSLDNPFSTGNNSKNHGLPPGPISNPSKDTLDAILTPTHNEDYYWCAKPGDGGSTTFYKKTQAKQQASDCKAPK